MTDQPTLPTQRCLLDGAHGAHNWIYTSSGGGHMLDERSVGDPRERNQRRLHCPGLLTVEQAKAAHPAYAPVSPGQISDAEHGEQVRARLAAATPGPWSSDAEWATISAGADSVIHGYFSDVCDSCGSPLEGDASVSLSVENAELIAHAPDDLARLLARAEAAEAKLARVQAALDSADGWRVPVAVIDLAIHRGDA